MESNEIVELIKRTPEGGGGSSKSFRFDPKDKEDFLRSKRNRKSSSKSNEVELSPACGKSYYSEVISVSFIRGAPEIMDISSIEDARRPLKSRRMEAKPFNCIDGRRPNQLGLGSLSQFTYRV